MERNDLVFVEYARVELAAPVMIKLLDGDCNTVITILTNYVGEVVREATPLHEYG